jgi:hypothetical protein
VAKTRTLVGETGSTKLSERRLLELGRRAEEEPAALAELKAYFADKPQDWEKFCRGFGDLARTAEEWFVAKITDSPLVREGIGRNLDALGGELLGPNPTPLERLLVERIRICWIHMQHAEVLYAQQCDKLTHSQADYYQRRIDRAQTRYLSAIKTLAQVRRARGE